MTRLFGRAPAVFALSLLTASPAAAQLTPTSTTTTSTSKTRPITVDAIEWDLDAEMDNRPGAMMVDLHGDGNKLWFLTRIAQADPDATVGSPAAPRVYQFDFRGGKRTRNATWFSWDLDPSGGVANGLRKIKSSHDKRFVFVHSGVSLQRIDTQSCTSCPRTVWRHNNTNPPDADHPVQPDHGSDIAIDEYNNVYAALASADLVTEEIFDEVLNEVIFIETLVPNPAKSFIQRLNPNSTYNNVTRFYVGNNVGVCPTMGSGAPCLSGIAIDRRNRDLVYYSEPGTADDPGAIAELNTRYATVRRWRFAELSTRTGDTIREPRQLHIDKSHTIWVVTGSGHLVSLDPRKNRMSKHRMPENTIERDLFGVAPDGGRIGYTNASAMTSPKVGLLLPDRQFVTVPPQSDPCQSDPCVPNERFTIPGEQQTAFRASGQTPPVPKTYAGQRFVNDDGTWIEGFTNQGSDSMLPLGIAADESARTGTFFVSIGEQANTVAFNRVARVRLPRDRNDRGDFERDDDNPDDDEKKNHEDDDVDGDGMPNYADGDSDNDGEPDYSDNDDDEDGIEDEHDTKDKKESKRTYEHQTAGGGSSDELFTISSNTLLVIASAVATDPLAPVSVEILNAAGTVVARSLQTLGTAAVTFVPTTGGDYTLRVKNGSVGGVSTTTKVLTREAWPVVLPL